MPFDPNKVLRAAGLTPAAPAQPQGPGHTPAHAPEAHPAACPCPLCESARLLADLTGPLGRIEDGIHQLVTMQQAETDRVDIDRPITLSASNPVRVDRNRRRYALLVLPAAASVSVELPGIGAFTASLSAGPNKLVVSDGTYLSLSTGNAVTALYRCTDYDPTGAA